MPELPEVETFKTYFDATALHQKIKDVETDDPIVLTTSPDELKAELTGESFEKTERLGKYLFVHLSSGRILVVHFGMTGHLKYFKDREDIPEFTQVLIIFQNGFHLSFIIKRKFARIGLADSVSNVREKKNLGADAMDLTKDDFISTFSARKAPVKNVLMDQSFAAGVGNWIADDVLFQTGIHPEVPANELSEKDSRSVHQKLQEILRLAIDKEARYNEFPDYYLVNHRNKKAKCPTCGEPLSNIKVGGRSTYLCPNKQKLS
ncbi:MAG: DNA-formamidopyrimidine glycosylase family protein [Cyclobacteriaceae bacterium]